MASAWADKLPVVTVERAAPKRVTFVLPYYENPQFLRQQVDGWGAYPDFVREHLSAIVVDDGSPQSPADAVLAGFVMPFPVRLFRIERDVPWNWLAARNIGMKYAAEGWCLLTDMDHVIPVSTARAVVFGHHKADVIYAFSRLEHSGEVITPHSASFLMTRSLFWTIGGYDEALSGHYGSDGDWRRRCAAVSPIHVLKDYLIRYERQGDSSTTRYQRKLPEDTAAVKRIVAGRGKHWTPTTLSFPYHEVAL